MLHVKPLEDSEADEQVIALYSKIRDAFKLDTTPLFFQYMGRFPDFLEYIWGSIEKNIERESFWKLSDACKSTCLALFSDAYVPSVTAQSMIKELISRDTSSHFISAKLKNLSQTNAAIALLFVAMREAVKGWALSTKLLKDKYEDARYDRVTQSVEKEVETSIMEDASNIQLSRNTEQFDYVKFMVLVQSEVDDSQKKESHLHARLALEEYLVENCQKVEIDLTYRTLAEYAQNYKNFDELVYLLSESFPTIAATRVIVSSIGTILLTSPLAGRVDS